MSNNIDVYMNDPVAFARDLLRDALTCGQSISRVSERNPVGDRVDLEDYYRTCGQFKNFIPQRITTVDA